MSRLNEVAVITGAASGIGSGLARVALERGMRVMLADIDAAQLAAFASTLDGEIELCTVDVGNPESVEALAERSYAAFGQVDLLFNNAGILIGGKSWEITPAHWERMMRVNVLGVVHGVASFVPRMIAAGRPARVINTASMAGLVASPLLSPYSASKFAVVSISESLAVELEVEKSLVTASVLCPGPVQTRIFRDTVDMTGDAAIVGAIGTMRQHTLAGITPEELALRTFAGIDAGQFWLIPQPEILDHLYRHRADNILSRKNPSASDYGTDSLVNG